MGDHTFHMFHTLFYVHPHPAVKAGQGYRTVLSLTVHMCGERVSERVWAARKKEKRKEAPDTKPPPASLFFITGTEIRTRRDSHALVSSLGETMMMNAELLWQPDGRGAATWYRRQSHAGMGGEQEAPGRWRGNPSKCQKPVVKQD